MHSEVAKKEMNLNKLLATLLSVMLLVIGLVAGAALFFVLVFVFVAIWATFKVRQMWARITGKPMVQTFSAGRFDPRNGFQQAYSSVRKGSHASASGSATTHSRGQIQDVTDVEPRPPSRTD